MLTTDFKKLSIFVVLGILAVLSVYLLFPIMLSIIIGLLLSYVFYPIYKKIFYFTNKKNISALIVIFFIIFLVFIPLWFLIPAIAKQIFDVYLLIQKLNVINFFRTIFPTSEISKDFALSLHNFIIDLAKKVLSSVSSFLLDLPNLALKAVVVLFVFFFGMRDAEILKKYIISLSPFSKPVEKNLTDRFKKITNAIIYGQIIVGIIQGIVAGIGLLIFGIPNSLTLTIIAIFVSMIPILGPWLIWVPAGIYLFLNQKTGMAIGLLVYGLVIVSWTDNLIRPYLIARKAKISVPIVLVGMIGGLIVFGILGLIIGPLILSYLLLVLDAYRNNKFLSLFSKT